MNNIEHYTVYNTLHPESHSHNYWKLERSIYYLSSSLYRKLNLINYELFEKEKKMLKICQRLQKQTHWLLNCRSHIISAIYDIVKLHGTGQDWIGWMYCIMYSICYKMCIKIKDCSSSGWFYSIMYNVIVNRSVKRRGGWGTFNVADRMWRHTRSCLL